MFSWKRSLFYVFIIHLMNVKSELNLHYTDGMNENVLQHDCLRVKAYFGKTSDEYQTVEYCLSEISSKFDIEKTNVFPKLTFAELDEANITSEQLYHWSTPMDLIERYQSYLNDRSTPGKEVVFNCTKGRFGSLCQYQLLYHHLGNFSLFEYIRDFQSMFRVPPATYSCYLHLQCNRGASPACLDWSEICDGKIDCLDSGIDEKDCWQLEINECKDDEYRCINGQCIPKSFDRDYNVIVDCIDGSDDTIPYLRVPGRFYRYEQPVFGCDDVMCKHSHFTSSCVGERQTILIKSMFLNRNSAGSEECWLALQCLIDSNDSSNGKCQEAVQNTCPSMLYFPSIPGLFGDIYFGYQRDNLENLMTFPPLSFNICYKKSHYNDFFSNLSKIFIDDMTCIHSKHFYPSPDPFPLEWKYEYDNRIYILFQHLKRYHLNFNYTSTICNRWNMYQCINSSKCISIHRLRDSSYDCPQMDDENLNLINNTNLMQKLNKYRFLCQSSQKYIHLALRDNLVCDCKDNESEGCEDERSQSEDLTDEIFFQNICDGFIDIKPMIIEGRNETDETECQQWPCNNIYTHCNDLWNCPHGLDEAGCMSSSILNCSSQHHLCVSPITNRFVCLSIEQANDGHIDCLTATDEPTRCEQITTINHFYEFSCFNDSSKSCFPKKYLCDGHKHCKHGDDERFCAANRSDIEKFIYQRLTAKIRHRKYLAFNGMSELFTLPAIVLPPIIRLSGEKQLRCHRGLDLDVWLNNRNNTTTRTCLCPPSFYGDQCQYQNQRISLAIRFRVPSDSYQTVFAIVASLIDDNDERMIHSYEQFTFLSMRDCKVKFNIYLLYATRPKNLSQNYSIRIDIYEKISLSHRGSVLFPVAFSFLPVHRLAFIVDIPPDYNNHQKCSHDLCVHGECFRYWNNRDNEHFCRCDPGWSGRDCTIKHICTCASDSRCVGMSANNQSICICPINKFGRRCSLPATVCQTDNNPTCKNSGRCVPNDDDYMESKQKFVCICRKGFTGDRCEQAGNKLILSFADDIVFSQSVFIHFIEIINMHNPPVRATTFKTIPVRQDSVTVYWSRPFHLAFIELANKNYYLTIVQKVYNPSTTIVKRIEAADRCRHISEVLNETMGRWHLLRRIKYYHLPCQTYSSDLKCFYDDVHLCLCYDFGQQRLANCFNFDHHMTFDCLGQSVCQNGAQCLQDHPECPTSSLCMCPPCSYGRRCQFSTNGFGLSLDAILGYHILPHLSFAEQPFIIKMSFAWTVIFFVAGLLNGILSLMTFKNKSVCEVGCGLYLLGSSITSLLTMTIFGLKFVILVLAQMAVISNRSFLSIQCQSIDFIIRICLCMDQWLNACVAIERAITAIKGTSFDKRRSKKTAKIVIVILLIVVTGTSVHDPIHRRLIDERNNDDDNLQRIWCVVNYSSFLQVYNYIIYGCHFCGAFVINLVSVGILIKKKSRQNATIRPQIARREHRQGQSRQHKHLLTAPIVLVILALPRLIISFVSKCMQSANDSWLFLAGYFCSFVPPMLTFVVFILPSKFYRKEFRKSVQQLRRVIKRRLDLF